MREACTPGRKPGNLDSPLIRTNQSGKKRHPIPALEMREQISVLPNDYERWRQVRGGWRGHHKPQGYMVHG